MRDKFLMFASRVGSQRHLSAIRDSFAMIMPLIIAGSIATTLNQLHRMFNLKESFLPGFLITINGNVWWGTFDMMAIFVVILIGYNLAKSYDANPPIAAVVALSAYLTIVPQAPPGGDWGSVSRVYTGAVALFVGMLVSIFATEIFVRLSKNESLVIKMPDGVPPAVSRSFAALIPGIAAIFGTGLIIFILEKVFNVLVYSEVQANIFEIITKFVSAPVRNLADSLGAFLVVTFFQHFLWVFGLHGSNILEGIIQPIYMPLLEANIAAYAAGNPIPHIVTKQTLDTFINIGGSGATLGLIASIFIVSKNKAKRAVASLSAAPGFFNINEPAIFGLPIVLNPILALPFLMTPFVTTIVTWTALYFNIAGRIIAIAPWSTPPFLSAVLTTDKPIMSCVLQLVNLAISIVIYIPFVLMSDKVEEKKEIEMQAKNNSKASDISF